MSAVLLRWIVASLLAVLLSLHGYKKKSLDWTGCIAAFFVGIVSLGTSYRFGCLLLLFYYSSSKLTKLKEDLKAKYEDSYLIGGQRNWIQVFVSSILAVLVCLYYQFQFGEDQNIDFSNSNTLYTASQLSCLIVAHYACANGDTWASEVGILSKPKPRLITTFCLREVPHGTNGGVSFLGTVASGLGGAFIGFVYCLFSFLSLFTDSPDSTSLAWSPQIKQQLLMILYGGICGVLGSVIDSVLGATCQASFYSEQKKKIVKSYDLKKDPSVKIISGADILSNEAVNFLSIAITMILSLFLAPTFFLSFVRVL